MIYHRFSNDFSQMFQWFVNDFSMIFQWFLGPILIGFWPILASFWELFGSLLAPFGPPTSMSGFCRQLVGILGRLGWHFGSILGPLLHQKLIEKSMIFLFNFSFDFSLILGAKMTCKTLPEPFKNQAKNQSKKQHDFQVIVWQYLSKKQSRETRKSWYSIVIYSIF